MAVALRLSSCSHRTLRRLTQFSTTTTNVPHIEHGVPRKVEPAPSVSEASQSPAPSLPDLKTTHFGYTTVVETDKSSLGAHFTPHFTPLFPWILCVIRHSSGSITLCFMQPICLSLSLCIYTHTHAHTRACTQYCSSLHILTHVHTLFLSHRVLFLCLSVSLPLILSISVSL